MIRKNLLSMMLICLTVLTQAQGGEDKKLVEEGNNHYRKGDFKKAGECYDKALKKNNRNSNALFNKGDAQYRQEQYEQAADAFAEGAHKATSKKDRSKAYHNLGNSYMRMNKYDEAIDAYKNALRQVPNDDSTRYNLAYALKKRKQNKDNNQNQNKDNNQNKDQNNKNQKNQDQKDKQDQKDQKNQQDDNKDSKPSEKENQAREKPDRMKAQQMLDAADENEKKLRAKIEGGKKKKENTKSGKDW